MDKKTFSICPSCIHVNTCILTEAKDKVWSCSEYDDLLHEENTSKPLVQIHEVELI
ncbi:MAG TPA: hypothetical protein VFF15_03285 [Flavobacteriaceae bacterium]|nr:hypothetical protein [Flavobacteriaceae bacterium]